MKHLLLQAIRRNMYNMMDIGEGEAKPPNVHETIVAAMGRAMYPSTINLLRAHGIAGSAKHLK